MVRANWTRVSGAYEQCIRAVWPTSDYLPPRLPAFLAEMTARLSPSYYNHEDEFIADALVAYQEAAESAGLGRLEAAALYRDEVMSRNGFYRQDTVSARRKPTPFEATVETGRRLRDIREIERCLQSVSVAAILGGSASYGRFFNVKGGNDASDLDILLIVEDWASAEKALAAVSLLDMASSASIGAAIARIGELPGSEADPDNIAFSAKVPLWGETPDPQTDSIGISSPYLVSFHLLTRDAFDRLMLKDAEEIKVEDAGAEIVFYDYRDSAPTRVDMQRAFNGRALRIETENVTHGSSYVRETIGFTIREGCYYPGMFQNLVLPGFDVRWGDARTRNVVEAFRWKMIDRLRAEQRDRPDEYMRLSLAHTRSEVFAPHTVRSVDQSTRLA